MKILFTTIFDYPHTGGLSTHISTLTDGLEAHGHQSRITSFLSLPHGYRKWAIQGPSFAMNKVSKGSGFYYSQTMRKLALKKLLQREKEINSLTLIHAQDVFSALASIGISKPTVLTVHGYFAKEGVSKGAMKKGRFIYPKMLEAEKIAYRSAAAVITVDERLRDYVYKLSGVKATIMPNFIDTSSFQPEKLTKDKARQALNLDPEKKYLLIPRRLTEKNGVVHAAHIVAYLRKKQPNVHLLFAGDGEAKREIARVVDRDRLHGHLTLLGNVPHEKMPLYYAASDLVLIPSIHSNGVEEATSISALEAMGSGVPVIAGNVGGLKQLIEDGVSGRLVDATHHTAFSEAVLSLLEDEPKKLQFAASARKKVCNDHSHIAAAKDMVRFYESIGALSS